MKAIRKDFWREIKSTKSRFISILVLVALAVAFLSGLKATAPDMKMTGHNYFEKQKLADVQIMSTVGLTDEDLKLLLENENVEEAEACYVIDAFASSPTTDKIAKVYSVPETEINSLLLMEGRLPEKINECVIEELATGELGVKIGDKISLNPQASFEDALLEKEFTIVGYVRSPIYISVERGSSSIGTGSVALYMAIPKDTFDSEIYTNIFLRLKKDADMTAFYDEYNDYVDDYIDSIEDFGNERAKVRYAELLKKVDDAQIELDDAKSDADRELADAQKKLDDANEEIRKGKKEIADADIKLADAEVKIADAEKEIADGEQELSDAAIELADALKKLEDGEKEYADGKKEIDSAVNDLYYAESQISAGQAQIDAARNKIETSVNGLNQAKFAISISPASVETVVQGIIENLQQDPDAATMIASIPSVYIESIDTTEEAFGCIDLLIGKLEDVYDEIDRQQASLNSYASQVSSGWYEVSKGRKELKKAREELDDGWAEYNDGLKEYEDGLKELEDGRKELEEHKIELEDAKVELADAKKTLAKGEKEYLDGLAEYNDAKADADREIADAQKKIDDAREDLEDITDIKWYVFSRDYNPGYTGLGQDADRMGNLAKVFPVIFFLVAALVCLTTMTRMVEEQRIEIGGMKALGYGTFDISVKYIGYGLIPSIIGSAIGLVIGYTLFPTMIFTAYQIMYQMPNIEVHAYSTLSVGCTAAAIACTTLASLAACLATLREVPARLMMPKTPKAGKRVFLEYIGFIWNRLNFIRKVTARNLFRYKKRFFMTVIGIGGCTALIIAGFGMRYSLTYTMHRQYDDLLHYSAQISVSNNISDEDRDAIENFLENDKRITAYTDLRLGSMNAVSDTRSQSIYLYALETDEIPEYADLYDYDTGEVVTVKDDGIYIDQKLSELLGVDIGDEIFLDGDEKGYAKVAGIFEHYTGHFCYLTPKYYEEVFKEECVPNGAFLQFDDDSEERCNEIFEDLMNFDGVAGTSRMLDIKDTYLSSMERIDFVVVIIIASAGALALVVLYNLSNINITERRRELATIKVLGFYDNEVTAYVSRENVILTILGIALGILMGHYLHIWLVLSTEIDLMMFGRQTNPMSYLWAALLTVLFAVIANVMAHYKMKQIDMVESLKSAE